ncbi:DUF5711 family protein [Clostridium sp. J1101437_171009_A5]|uniref:DUF5711 family protein n=1 Tax=Clostridium sp. J1101437_171009_A5 TaxID=2787098 RepID=UPI0018974C46|nr:DUF5711 family protein [Clostridium sp. J1101437_171009_A5]
MELLQPKPTPPKKRPSRLLRLLAFLVTLALMAGAVALVANRDKLNLDGVRRWFNYRSLERSDSGQAESFSYDGGSASSFATLDDGLLVCSTASIRLYSGSGTLYVDQTISMEHPVIHSTEHSAVVYDAGGQDLFVFSGKEQVFSLSLKEDESLLSARLNQEGSLVVVAQESGYKGTVTVYGQDFQPIMRIKLSSRFVSDATLSPDGKSVALVTLGVNGSTFESTLELYQLSRTEEDVSPDYTCSLGNDVPLDLAWKSDGIWVLGQSSFTLVSPSGENKGSYDYSGQYLKGFSLNGEGYAVLLLGKYRAGSAADLIVLDHTGLVKASSSLHDQVFSLSAAGNYIAVLSAGRLDLYTPDLTLYRSLETTQGARRVIQRSDGSTMLMNADTAHLYVPN